MIGYLKAALTALEAAGVISKLIIALGLVASLAAAYAVWHHKVYQQGADDAVAAIAMEDDKRIDRALEYRGRWKLCKESGHGWDQSTGRCQ